VTERVEVVPSQADTVRLASTHEWRSVCTRHHCMLLEGPDGVTETVLSLLKPHLRTPVVWTGSESPLEFPCGPCGALVLRDVTALGRQEQLRLLARLNTPRARTQVVSTTSHPLFPWVVAGTSTSVVLPSECHTAVRGPACDRGDAGDLHRALGGSRTVTVTCGVNETR
jgi:hypothetical protein